MSYDLKSRKVPLSRGYISGMRTSWVSATQVDIGVGACKDSTNVYDITASATLNVLITASGANGLDTGIEAAGTWYAMFVIGDTTGANATAGLLSVSETSPTLPAGYDIFRRVGWVRNGDTSDFLEFKQVTDGNSRRINFWSHKSDTMIIVTGTATTPTALDLSSAVPASARHVYVMFEYLDGVTGDNFAFRPTGTLAGVANFNWNRNHSLGSGMAQEYRGHMDITTDGALSIDYEVDGGDIDLYVTGYIDRV